MMVNFEERIGFGQKEPGISVLEGRNRYGLWSRLLRFGKNKKFLLYFSKNRGHQILFNKLKNIINVYFFST